VILRAKEPNGSPPLVFLHGGPGDSGIRQFTRSVVEAKVDQHRDIVIYDQRGAGFSEPKLCPEYKDVERESQKLKTQKELEEFEKAGARKCISSLDARIERSAYDDENERPKAGVTPNIVRKFGDT
jgi:pimeloyl-ACP methyl ester carboxylesterase